MSPELLFQKISVAILLLSMIPGFIWGWKECEHESLPSRLFGGFIASLLPPTAIASVAIIVLLIGGAVAFVFG